MASRCTPPRRICASSRSGWRWRIPPLYQGRGIRIEDLREGNTGFNWRQLFFFLGAAIFVLLLTCVNVANLLLARALRRDREFAIQACARRRPHRPGAATDRGGRAAGISRRRARIAARRLGRRSHAGVDAARLLEPRYEIVLDVRVYLFAVATSAFTALLFGLAPAVLTSNRDLNPLLVQGSRALGGSPAQRRARHALVVVEMTIALVLLVGAGLFITSYTRLLDAPLGFEPANRITMRVMVNGGQYAGAPVPFAERLIETARAVPGVRDAAVGSSMPLTADRAADSRAPTSRDW